MSFLGQILSRQRPEPEVRFNNVLQALTLGNNTAAGRGVSESSALRATAVFACVRILAESVASLPLILYERQSDGGKQRASSQPLYSLLHDMPNPEMTSVELRETLMGHLATWGNAYAEIERDNANRVRALWPLRPDRMKVERVGRSLTYSYRVDDSARAIPIAANRVLHLKGLGFDGMQGYSPIALAREAIGLSLATEEFGSRFFGNGARPGAVLEHPAKLSPEAQANLIESWSNRHQGLSNAHRIAVLEEGMSLKEVGIPPEDAQFLETRRFQVTEIARIFRVPPHMLADLERATFSNIEHQSLEFVQHTLRPWLVRWEQSINMWLINPAQRNRLYAEHLIDGLLRGDVESRYQAYAIGRLNGWLSANDIRTKENMNPIEGGDQYLIPLNMVEAGSPPGTEANAVRSAAVGAWTSVPPSAPAAGETRQAIEYRTLAQDRLRLANAFHPVFLDTISRIIRREVNDVGRAVGKYLDRGDDLAGFLDWLGVFYQEHRDFWQRQLGPLLETYAAQLSPLIEAELGQPVGDPAEFLADYLQALAVREANSGQFQLEDLIEEAPEEERVAQLEERLASWDDHRADTVSHGETRRANNALAKALYLAAGVTALVWQSNGDSCPYCRDLDGVTVAIESWFLEKDTDFQPDGADRPINVGRNNVGHPPLHKGCDCMIVAKRR